MKFADFTRHGFVLESLFRGWAVFILILSLVAALMSIPGVGLIQIGGFLSAVILLILHGKFNTARSEKIDAKWSRFGVGLVSLTSLAGFVWAWKFDSVQISDFGVYYRCGTEIPGSIDAWINACQSNYLHKNLIYWTRALFYSAPLGALAGENYPLFKFYNALYHAATIALWFFGLRHYYGPRVAVIATAMLVLYPEWWFALTLVTTDNAVLFYLIAFLLLLPKIEGRNHSVWIVAGLSLSMFAANQLRTIGLLMALTVVAWSLALQCKEWRPRILLKGVSVLVLYGLLNALLGTLLPSSASEPLQLLKALSTIDFSTTQDFGSNYAWYEHFWFAMPSEWRGWVAIHKILLEFSQGFQHWPVYLYQKTALLFSGTGYYGFSSFHFTGVNPDSAFPVSVSTVPFRSELFPWLAAPLIFLLTISAWALLRLRLRGLGMIVVIWLGVFALIILGLGEVQPRYSVLVAPALALLAAVALFPKDQGGVSEQSTRGELVTLSVVLGLGILVLLFCIASFSAHLVSTSLALRMPLLTHPHLPKPSLTKCKDMPAELKTSYKKLSVITPKGTTCTTIKIPLSKAAKAVTFFVSGAQFPFPFEPRIRSSYRYQATFKGRQLLDSSLGENSVQWHKLALDATSTDDDSQELALTVYRKDASREETIDFWLFLTRLE